MLVLDHGLLLLNRLLILHGLRVLLHHRLRVGLRLQRLQRLLRLRLLPLQSCLLTLEHLHLQGCDAVCLLLRLRLLHRGVRLRLACLLLLRLPRLQRLLMLRLLLLKSRLLMLERLRLQLVLTLQRLRLQRLTRAYYAARLLLYPRLLLKAEGIVLACSAGCSTGGELISQGLPCRRSC